MIKFFGVWLANFNVSIKASTSVRKQTTSNNNKKAVIRSYLLKQPKLKVVLLKK